MPELPEVEVTRRTLLKFIENKVIKNIKINNPNLRFKIPVNFKKNLTGQKIIKVLRRSKYILIYLKNDYVMIAHLGMSGKFLIKNNYSKDFLKMAKLLLLPREDIFSLAALDLSNAIEHYFIAAFLLFVILILRQIAKSKPVPPFSRESVASTC